MFCIKKGCEVSGPEDRLLQAVSLMLLSESNLPRHTPLWKQFSSSGLGRGTVPVTGNQQMRCKQIPNKLLLCWGLAFPGHCCHPERKLSPDQPFKEEACWGEKVPVEPSPKLCLSWMPSHEIVHVPPARKVISQPRKSPQMISCFFKHEGLRQLPTQQNVAETGLFNSNRRS